MVIFVGFVMGMPEPRGFDAVTRELRRWRERQRSDGSGEASIDVVVHIPGPLYEPGFVGVRRGRRSAREKMVQVDVALARDDLSPPPKLASALAAGVSDAVKAAIADARSHDISLPADRYRDDAAQLIQRMRRRKRWSVRPSPSEVETLRQIREIEGERAAPRHPPPLPEPEHEEAVVQVHLATAAAGAAGREKLFEIEDQLVEAVEASGSGYFDGNEIGLDEHVLYFCGPRRDPLLAALHAALDRIPTMPAGRGSHPRDVSGRFSVEATRGGQAAWIGTARRCSRYGRSW